MVPSKTPLRSLSCTLATSVTCILWVKLQYYLLKLEPQCKITGFKWKSAMLPFNDLTTVIRNGRIKLL